ncbi:unnamed protein product [Moneuplotes crassus]|uniref:Uncharacterized protein n=1 Tax=Euplotes crassus TaxID=5936 RepID=A0AAD1UIK8_EUPCR|nr:unnamed protein product [Moneuplotes crassus]
MDPQEDCSRKETPSSIENSSENACVEDDQIELHDQDETKDSENSSQSMTETKFNLAKARKKFLPNDMTIEIELLLQNPIEIHQVSGIGIDVSSITKITKFLQKEGVGETPNFNDKIIHNHEIRYANGYLYDIKKRKEPKSVTLEDPGCYIFLQDCLRSMKNGEISLFKIQFVNEESNPYLKDPHSCKFLPSEVAQAINDKTCVFMKFTVKSILRDCKDISAAEIKELRKNLPRFIDERISYATDCKTHAKIALTENSLNDAMKIYRKGTGAIKTISQAILNKMREDAKSKGEEEEQKLQLKITHINDIMVQMMLNLGYCYWKHKDWPKMKLTNSDIIHNYAPKSIKALYRYSIACKELDNIKEGLEAMTTLVKLEPKNKDALKLYKTLKTASHYKKSKWNRKMDGFFVKQDHSYHRLEEEELKKDILRRKIEFELNNQ